MKKYEKIPLLGYLFLSIINLFFGISGISTKELSLKQLDYVYFHETGNSAVYGGLFFLLLGLYFGFAYFKGLKNEVLFLLKSKSKLNIVYILWVLLVFFPIISKIVNMPELLETVFIILLCILTLYYSTRFHQKIKNMILE